MRTISLVIYHLFFLSDFSSCKNEIYEYHEKIKMNIESIRMEMDIAGCVQFFHPALQHDYYIIEQKLDKDHNFIPIEDGVYVFHVMKGHDNAIQTELTDITHLYEFIKQLYEEDYNILPDHMEIPKKNFVKWQFDRKLK